MSMQTSNDIIVTLRRHLEAEARHDAAAAAACYVEDGTYDHVSLGLRLQGRDAVEMQYQSTYDALPDLAFIVEDELITEDRVVQWGRITGTLTGAFIGVEGTGGTIDVRSIATYTFRDGLIAGETVFYDLATMADQAGLDLAELRDTAAQLQAMLAA